ncbi:MAG: hypothetical protein KDK90_12220 [Leptospiraceae bacterium]|nr:hypothetical protein [Leptospiraceae bacterium]
MRLVFKMPTIILLSLLSFSHCNPFQKKIDALKKCEVNLKTLEVTKFRMMLLPPVPKMEFLANLEVINTNDIEVTIEKFDFNVSEISSTNELLKLAYTKSEIKHKLKPHETKIIPVTLITVLEQNKENGFVKLLKELVKSMLNKGEMNLLLEGKIEFDTILGNFNVPIKEKRVVNLFKNKKNQK